MKNIGYNRLIGCDDVGNLLIWNINDLSLVRSIPYGHMLRDAVGTKEHVFCAFELKLVVFDRKDYSIEVKFDTC